MILSQKTIMMKSLTITVINRSCRKRILFGITAFVAAAQHGSFTAAADKLGITKSAAGYVLIYLRHSAAAG